MGFLVSFNRKMTLTNMANKLEAELDKMTSQKYEYMDQLVKIQSAQATVSADDANSAIVKEYEAYKKQIEAWEKQIDLKMQQVQTKLQSVNTELQSNDQLLQSELQKSFSYNAGGR